MTPDAVAEYSPSLSETLPLYCLPFTVTENEVEVSSEIWLELMPPPPPEAPPPPPDLEEDDEDDDEVLAVEEAEFPAALIVTVSDFKELPAVAEVDFVVEAAELTTVVPGE